MTAWGEEKFKEAKDSNGGAYTLDQTNDPVLTRCYPPGTPRVYFHPYPFEFVQAKKFMLMVFEYDHTIRRIYTDGRALPDDPDPSWMGYSVGHWDGNTTFVVDTVGFNEKTWLDRLGHAHSEQLHVTERFRRVDRDHLELDITMTDPKALAKPWTTTFYYQNRPDWELGEISARETTWISASSKASASKIKTVKTQRRPNKTDLLAPWGKSLRNRSGPTITVQSADSSRWIAEG